MLTKFPEMKGAKFGRLVAEECLGRIKRKTIWRCRCDCGELVQVEQFNLRKGNVRSCGCYRRERAVETNTTHGWASHRICIVWHGMIARCTNPKSDSFEHYGGRGISVCERWKESLQAFIDDMGLPPSKRHSIDRVDNSGNYEPGNCRWSLPYEQARNTRRTRNITFRGKTQCMKDWADELGINYDCLIGRLRRGWTPEEALSGGRF